MSEEKQEFEFILEGITTRMQLAIEKMAESNRQMSESNRRLCEVLKIMCATVIAVVVIVAMCLTVNNRLWMTREERTGTNTASEVVTDAGTDVDASIPESGP